MFRATPEMEQISDCLTQDNDIIVTLGKLDVVYLEDGSEKQAKDLVQGDRVELLENRKEMFYGLRHK